jgi:hypothetical protein
MVSMMGMVVMMVNMLFLMSVLDDDMQTTSNRGRSAQDLCLSCLALETLQRRVLTNLSVAQSFQSCLLSWPCQGKDTP